MIETSSLVLFVNYIVPSFIVLCSIFLGYLSIRKWLAEPYNHEQIFYWGISFIIVSLAALNALCCAIFGFGIKNSTAMHVWVAIAIWFQLFAIASVRNTTQHDRKKLRLAMWLLFLFAATVISVVVTSTSCAKETCNGLLSLQTVPISALDLAFELLYGTAILIIIAYLKPIRNIRHAYFCLYNAFTLFLIGRLANIINLKVCSMSNTYLIYSEWLLVVAGMFFLVSAVYNLITYNK